jgi:threonine dehydrogenase-like Zn-dependent dehydrogenase
MEEMSVRLGIGLAGSLVIRGIGNGGVIVTMDRHDRQIASADASIEGAVTNDAPTTDFGDDWVHEIIAMTRPGVEIQFPVRSIDEREVPFAYDDFR